MLKKGVRILAIASGPIQTSRKSTILVGVVFRDGTIEGVLSESIAVNGADATEKIVRMVLRSRFREQIKIVASNGIAIAGLNVLDLGLMERRLRVHTVVLTRKKPHEGELLMALRRFGEAGGKNVESRIEEVKTANLRGFSRIGGFYLQSGLDKNDLKAIYGQAFESLRIAHLIAKGVSYGESKGRI
ncbi:MAG: DUF99 family protein [Candidatus Marsarchaeota archaeon]|nr:DUF99 family protein [Candidatus Marsarchaeota archaeon]